MWVFDRITFSPADEASRGIGEASMRGPALRCLHDSVPLHGLVLRVLAVMRLQRWVDGLSPVRQSFAWVGLSLASYLVLTVALVLTGTPTLGKMGPMWVILLAAGGIAGSKHRNRHADQYDSAVLALRRRDQEHTVSMPPEG